MSLAAAAKARGTAAYKQRDFAGAKAEYAAAIVALSEDESERAELEPALLANLGACAIALEEWSGAVEVTTRCLEVDPAHVKARYRRACAYEKLREFEKAFTDMARVVHADPTNARAKAAARRLRESIAKRPVAAPLVEAVKTLRSLVEGEASTYPPKRAALTLLSAAQGEQGEGARACARVGGIDALWRVVVAQPPVARDVVGPAMAALAALACRTDRAVDSSRVVSNELADWPLLNALTKTFVRSREKADDIHARSALRLLSCAAVPHPNIATAENPDRTMIYPKERAEIVSRSTLPPSPLEHEAVRAVIDALKVCAGSETGPLGALSGAASSSSLLSGAVQAAARLCAEPRVAILFTHPRYKGTTALLNFADKEKDADDEGSERVAIGKQVLLAVSRIFNARECSFIDRYILRESCSQFDSLPLTSLALSRGVRPSHSEPRAEEVERGHGEGVD